MNSFIRQATVVRAVQWNPGDDALDRRLGIIAQPTTGLGFLYGPAGRGVVRPGCWVVAEPDGRTVIWTDEQFRAAHRPQPDGATRP